MYVPVFFYLFAELAKKIKRKILVMSMKLCSERNEYHNGVFPSLFRDNVSG